MNHVAAVLLVFGVIWIALGTLCTLGEPGDMARAGAMCFAGLCLVITAALLRRPPAGPP